MSEDSTSVALMRANSSTVDIDMDEYGNSTHYFSPGFHIDGLNFIRPLAGANAIEVWEARSRLKVPVVVKIAPFPFCQSIVDSVYQEHDGLRVANTLSDRVPRLLDFNDAKFPYVVMQYIDGVTARDVFEQGIGVAQSLGLCRRVASILSDLHNGGVMHMDVKPTNVMVDEWHRVHLIDFGCAIVPEAHRTYIHDSTIIQGTIPYMAPELLYGLRNPDVRMDLYSLTRMMGEFVTGGSVEPPAGYSNMQSAQFYASMAKKGQFPSIVVADDGFAPYERGMMRSGEYDIDARHTSAKEFMLDLDIARRALGHTESYFE